MARIVELIHTFDRRGKGTPEDPFRQVFQLWDKTGRLIAEKDPEGKDFCSGYMEDRL